MPRLRLSSPVWLAAGLCLLALAHVGGLFRLCTWRSSVDLDLRNSLRAQMEAFLRNPGSDTMLGERRLNYLKACMHACDAPGKKTLSGITWVHIPKCGTSLGLLLFHYACEAQDIPAQSAPAPDPECTCSDVRKWDPNIVEHLWAEKYRFTHVACIPGITLHASMIDHRPEAWRAPENLEEYAGTFVAMFRDPRKRLVAAYNDGKHANGLTEERGDAFLHVSTLEEYIAFPGIKGCQTKMVLGYLCTDTVPLSMQDLHEAKRRITQDYAFVGLTDAWNMSACLFHSMFGGDLSRESFRNIHPGAQDVHAGMLMQDAAHLAPMNKILVGNATFVDPDVWESLSPQVDPFDWQLYVTAKAVFYERVLKYNLV